jgi:hypothetical protein
MSALPLGEASGEVAAAKLAAMSEAEPSSMSDPKPGPGLSLKPRVSCSPVACKIIMLLTGLRGPTRTNARMIGKFSRLKD